MNMSEFDLNSEMEGITEEQANELIDIMKAFNDEMPQTIESLKRLNEAVWKEMARQAASKLIGYMEKYANATFVTRWYWRKKARVMVGCLKEISKEFDKGI